jgi:hypothetical protein
MSKTENLTFETVNAHVEKYYTPAMAAAKPAATSLCGVYGTIRPVLELLAAFPVVPQKWRNALNTLLGVLDTMCPQAQNA